MKIFILNTILLIFFIIESFGAKLPSDDIVILFTNDVHCAVNETIGYPGLSYYRRIVNSNTPYVALVDAGDHAQGGAIGTISKGTFIIDIMNNINYDVVIPGNHEFDYGMEQFIEFSKTLTTGYTSCNFRKNGKLVFDPFKIISFGEGDDEVKVGFIGISTPESITKSVPIYFQDSAGNYIYDFDGDNLVASVQEAVNSARSEGADYIIAVGHLGESADITETWKAQTIVAQTTGIDVFIDGHSHDVTECLKRKNLDGKEVPITQSGTRLVNIGQVTIGKDGSIKTEIINKEKIPSFEKASSDEKEINNILLKIQSQYEEKLNEVIGHVDFELTISDKDGNRIIMNTETNLSDLITDSLLDKAKDYGGADVAFSNGGGIRASIPAGDITYGEVINTLPFENNICIVEVSGETILDALELSVNKYPAESGGFLHGSGITYTINPNIKSSVEFDDKKIFVRVGGERRISNAKIGGEPIVYKKKYKVIGYDYFLLNKGDGYVFKNAKIIIDSIGLPNQLFISYVQKIGDGIKNYEKPQKRITILESNNEPVNNEPVNNEPVNNEPVLDTKSGSVKSLYYNIKLSGFLFIAMYIIFCIIM